MKRILTLLCVVLLLPGLIVHRAAASEISDFTKEEGKSSYTIPQDNYAVVKQADWYFVWTPTPDAQEADILTDAQSNDPSLDKSSYLGSFSGTDQAITFEEQQNSGVYQFSPNEDGSYTLDILNRDGEADAGKASHVGCGVYTGSTPRNPDPQADPGASVTPDPPVNPEPRVNPDSPAEPIYTAASDSGNPKTGDVIGLPFVTMGLCSMLLIPLWKKNRQ